MLRILGVVTAIAVLASAGNLAAPEAEAQDKRARVHACGGPARDYNQCLLVCSCMGRKSCVMPCGKKSFDRGGKASSPKGKRGPGR